MQTLENYISNKYMNKPTWFEEEVKTGENLNRISSAIDARNYLTGQHRVLLRQDFKHKNEVYEVAKMILQTAKILVNFHSTYILGKPISLGGSEGMVKAYNQIYRKGRYNKLNFDIVDCMLKYGEVYEYVYYDSTNIKSKIIHSEDGYPLYAEDTGEYIGFIEYYTSSSNNVSYYNIYYPNRVESYNDEGSILHHTGTATSFGLPIIYRNNDNIGSDGISVLDDIKPILDEYESFINKLSDTIYVQAINPILMATGAYLDLPSTIDADSTGYAIMMDNGSDMKYVSATLDYNSIKLYIENLLNQLYQIASVPSVLMGNSNVANVSEVSLKLMFQCADNKANSLAYVLLDGFESRHDIMQNILAKKGNNFKEDEYLEVQFSYSRPVADTDTVNNLSTQYQDGAIDLQTYIENSPLTKNVDMVLKRLDDKVQS
ncbi:MAG: phage portal protein [Cellulosilyticaceae bacterium]